MIILIDLFKPVLAMRLTGDILLKTTLHRFPVLLGIYCKIFAPVLLQKLPLSLGSLGQELLGLTFKTRLGPIFSDTVCQTKLRRLLFRQRPLQPFVSLLLFYLSYLIFVCCSDVCLYVSSSCKALCALFNL